MAKAKATAHAVALLGMVRPFFGPEIVEDLNKRKGLRPQNSGFSVQKQVKTKGKNFFAVKLLGFRSGANEVGEQRK